jgi:hypothetical protein
MKLKQTIEKEKKDSEIERSGDDKGSEYINNLNSKDLTDHDFEPTMNEILAKNGDGRLRLQISSD